MGPRALTVENIVLWIRLERSHNYRHDGIILVDFSVSEKDK